MHHTAIIAAGLLLPKHLLAATKEPRYRIAVCDWMILKRQKLGAFQLTKDIGADGVEVDMGGLGNRPTFDSKLGDPVVRQQFISKAAELNIAISSIAMSGFYAQSFAERENVDQMVQDCIDTMVQLKVRIAFLPLGVEGDLIKHPELRPKIIERLKAVGIQAKKAGVIIGIETALSAAEELKLLDEIGSPAIQSYFNFSNALQAGRDLHQELRILGKRICQIHCTDTDGVLLQHNTRIDMRQVKHTLDKIGWRGWLVIERSRDANDVKNVKGNFSANTAYLKSIFQ
jgi:sugar phosphate isomerase/epimerase